MLHGLFFSDIRHLHLGTQVLATIRRILTELIRMLSQEKRL